MNKKELVEDLYEYFDRTITKQNINAVVGGVFGLIQETVASGEKVTIVGFGTFEKRERAERQGRNVRTGETITIPATSVPVFSAGKPFKDMVAGE